MLTETRDRLAGYFAGRGSRAALLARSLLEQPDPGDDQLRDHLISAKLATIGADGSVGGSFFATAQAVLDLDELGLGAGGSEPPVQWLLARQDIPGAFHQGCTAARHPHRTCEHFLGGFFAPAAPSRRAAPVSLPNGKEYRVESHARFALSCVALEAVVRTGWADAPLVRRHLESFGALLDEWRAWSDHLTPDLAFQAIRALGSAADGAPGVLDGLLELVARKQLPDGTWPQTDFFHALDALGRYGSRRGDDMLRRAVPTLSRRQRDDGSFGSVAADERGLIGARAMILAAVGT